MDAFIQCAFSKRECIQFVPITYSSSICGCGRLAEEHPETSANATATIPGTWSIDEHTKKAPTDSYGVIEFVGRNRKAKYVRLDLDSSQANVMRLLLTYWGLFRPKLVITIHGGSDNFDLQPKLEQVFTHGLLKAAKTTGTWIITSGANTGVLKYVEKALNVVENSSSSRRNRVCIGVTNWGDLPNNQQFIGERANVQYHSKNCVNDGNRRTLSDTHTHFLLVDDGTVHRKAAAQLTLRKSLMKFISRLPMSEEDANSDGIPVVCLVLEGGSLTIDIVLEYIYSQPPIPVVVCDGSGRAADLLAFAHKYGGRNGEFPATVRSPLLAVIKAAFICDNNKADDVFQQLRLCLIRKNMIMVYRMGEYANLDIDYAILAASVRSHSGDNYDKLMRTLSWNRADIADSEIFANESPWHAEQLEAAMMKALTHDRVDFVHLLLEHGVAMERFLTFRRLEKLYNTRKGPPHTLDLVVKDVVAFAHSGYRIRLYDVGLVMDKLMGNAYTSSYRQEKFKRYHASSSLASIGFLRPHSKKSETHDNPADNYFRYPFHELFVWAVLTKRQAMALCMWKYGEESMAKALVAAKLYEALAEEAADDYLEAEICEGFRNHSKEFKNLAFQLLDQCHKSDTLRTLQLLTYELTRWSGLTCLALAVQANHMQYLAHTCCQALLADLWHGGMRIRKRSNLRVLLGLFIPPLLFTLEFKTQKELRLQPQTADEHLDNVRSDISIDRESESESASSSDSNENTRLTHRRIPIFDKKRRNVRRISHMIQFPRNKVAPDYNTFKENNTTAIVEEIKPNHRKQYDTRATSLSYTKRITEFYAAPITTFWSWTVAYLIFLLSFTYVVLLKLPPIKPPGIEIYLMTYVLTIAMEILREFVTCRAKGIRQKLSIFLGGDLWNLNATISVCVFLVAFSLRFYTSTLSVARVLYACDLMFWYAHLFHILTASTKLGPYVTMIAKMLVSMFSIVTILLITLVAFGVFRQSILYPEHHQWRWDLFVNVTYKPYFMWFGEIYANEIDACDKGADCPAGSRLLPVALALYLLVTNILLINLLIAIFNNIFMEVDAVSQTLWKFNLYYQVMEYEAKPWLPPPFTICYFIFRLLKLAYYWFYKRLPTYDHALKLFLNETDVKALLEFEKDIMEDLQRKKVEAQSASADVRLYETALRTEYISAKLDDILAKQWSQKVQMQTIELDLQLLKNELTAMTAVRQSYPSESDSSTFDEPVIDRLRTDRGFSHDQSRTRAADHNDDHRWDRKRRPSLDQSDRLAFRIPRTRRLSAGEYAPLERKRSLLHGFAHYSSIADGIDVADCAPITTSNSGGGLEPIRSEADIRDQSIDQSDNVD